MDAVEFIKERNRMCKSFGDRCTGCPAFNACEDEPCCLVDQESTLDATTQVAMVEEWSVAHSRKTRQSEFLKIYPDTTIDINTGAIIICPATLSNSHQDENGMCNQLGVGCNDCQREFWLKEIE